MPPCICSTRSTISLALTPPKSLAIDCDWRESMPLSTCHAAASTSQRSASISTAESATIHWIAWRSAIGWPKVTRLRAHSMPISTSRSQEPMAWAGSM